MLPADVDGDWLVGEDANEFLVKKLDGVRAFPSGAHARRPAFMPTITSRLCRRPSQFVDLEVIPRRGRGIGIDPWEVPLSNIGNRYRALQDAATVGETTPSTRRFIHDRGLDGKFA